MAALIGLHPDEAQCSEFLGYFTGADALSNSDLLAMCYAGHQFGHYVPQLGDCRALLLGQARNREHASYDLHLKGGG